MFFIVWNVLSKHVLSCHQRDTGVCCNIIVHLENMESDRFFIDSGDVRDDLFTNEELIAKWKEQNSTAEFLMASRSMGTLPMTFSLVASFMSAITLLGTPADIYVSGTQYLVLPLAYPLVILATTKIYLPVFDALDVSTSYEYLGKRFGRPVHLLASLCFVIQMVIYMAIVVYTPALALSQVRITTTHQ